MVGQRAPSDGMQSRGEQLKRSADRFRPGWYRGVRLQRPVSPPRMPLEAVAVRRNLTKLARDGSDS